MLVCNISLVALKQYSNKLIGIFGDLNEILEMFQKYDFPIESKQKEGIELIHLFFLEETTLVFVATFAATD